MISKNLNKNSLVKFTYETTVLDLNISKGILFKDEEVPSRDEVVKELNILKKHADAINTFTKDTFRTIEEIENTINGSDALKKDKDNSVERMDFINRMSSGFAAKGTRVALDTVKSRAAIINQGIRAGELFYKRMDKSKKEK